MRMAVGRGCIVDRKGSFATVRERTSDALQGVIKPILPLLSTLDSSGNAL